MANQGGLLGMIKGGRNEKEKTSFTMWLKPSVMQLWRTIVNQQKLENKQSGVKGGYFFTNALADAMNIIKKSKVNFPAKDDKPRHETQKLDNSLIKDIGLYHSAKEVESNHKINVNDVIEKALKLLADERNIKY
jgi:uncharacterized protein YjiS (DUF1127 family)